MTMTQVLPFLMTRLEWSSRLLHSSHMKQHLVFVSEMYVIRQGAQSLFIFPFVTTSVPLLKVGVSITMKRNKSRFPPAYIGGCVAAFLLGGVLWSPAEIWRNLSAETAFSDKNLSDLGRSLLKDKSWVHIAVTGVTGHSDDEESLQEALAEADFFKRRLDGFSLDSSSNKTTQLFIITADRNWQQQLHSVDGRQDALAAQYQNEIYIFWDMKHPPANAVRLAHEMVHERLQNVACRSRLPVWLEEGLAGYLGWELASAYRQSKGNELFRQLPPVPADDIIPMDQLNAMTAYPDHPENARRMYRQAEEWVRQIAVRIGNDRLSEFVHAVCGEGMLWSDVLRNRFGYSDEDMKALEGEVREQLQGNGKK
jgi:hypothetical protein